MQNGWSHFKLATSGKHMLLRNGGLPAMSVNKNATVISNSSSKCEFLSPKGTWEGDEYLDLPAISGSHSLRWALRNSGGCEKCRVMAPDSLGTYEGGDFSEPRLLCLSIHRKVLNSLTWGIWFYLIHKNTFHAQTTCPLLQTSQTWLPHPTLLRAILSGPFEILSPRLKSWRFPLNKT